MKETELLKISNDLQARYNELNNIMRAKNKDDIKDNIIHKEYDGFIPTRKWGELIQLVVGENHYVGIKKNGDIVAAGREREGQCNIENWRNIKKIMLTDSATVGLHTDGTLTVAGSFGYDSFLLSPRDSETAERKIKEKIRKLKNVQNFWILRYRHIFGNLFIIVKNTGHTEVVFGKIVGNNQQNGKKKREIERKLKNITHLITTDTAIIGLKNNGTLGYVDLEEERGEGFDEPFDLKDISSIKDICNGRTWPESFFALRYDGTLIEVARGQQPSLFQGKYKKIVGAREGSGSGCAALKEDGTVNILSGFDSVAFGLGSEALDFSALSNIKDIFCTRYHCYAIDEELNIFTSHYEEELLLSKDKEQLFGKVTIPLKEDWRKYATDILPERYSIAFSEQDAKAGTIWMDFIL